jgi:hypothetical protein
MAREHLISAIAASIENEIQALIAEGTLESKNSPDTEAARQTILDSVCDDIMHELDAIS